MSSPSTPSPAAGASPMPLGLPAWAWSLLALLLGLAGSFLMADHEFRRQQRERSAELATISERGYASIADRLRALVIDPELDAAHVGVSEAVFVESVVAAARSGRHTVRGRQGHG